jgi:hypothetical protein
MAAGSLQSALVVSHCNYHLLFKDESIIIIIVKTLSSS